MSTFYDTSNNTGYLLYTYSNHIIIRSKKDNMFSKGQVLTSDFLQDLSDTQFNSSIYYSYIDLYNNLFSPMIGITSDKTVIPAKAPKSLKARKSPFKLFVNA